MIEKLGTPELLAGLAEECAELAFAALKLRRAIDKTNPTPVDEEMLWDNLSEEIADVTLYLQQIPFDDEYVEKVKAVKAERWERRMKDRERT